MMKTVTVNTNIPYAIQIGNGILTQIGKQMQAVVAPCKAAIITEDTVCDLYAPIVKQSLEQSGYTVCQYTFPAGEASKNITTWSHILEFLAEQEMTRKDVIVALGGGVVGDMAGFAAAVYQRGIAFVQIPTTFLAAIDASVGGKTAIDLNAGKNLAGAFHQPRLVVCDTEILKKLPERIFADGVAEALKYGVLGNEALFLQVAKGDIHNHLEEIVEMCVSMKRDIVEKDETEQGDRKLLNLGHTFGHAIEWKSNFQMTHGQAVGIGMVLVARAAEQMGKAKKGLTKQIEHALQNNHLPVDCGYSAKDLAEGALHDKKRKGDVIQFVFPYDIGQCEIVDISVSDVQKLAEIAMGK